MTITIKLFELIATKISDDKQYQENLKHIKTLLDHSEIYKKSDVLKTLAIDFAEVRSVLIPPYASAKYNLLQVAVLSEKIEVIKWLIEAGMDPNYFEENSGAACTALDLAARMDNVKVGTVLIENGANPNVVKPLTWATSLFYACYYGSVNFVKLLLLNGAKIDLKNVDKRSILEYAGREDAKPKDEQEEKDKKAKFEKIDKLLKAIKHIEQAKTTLHQNIFKATAFLNLAFENDAEFTLQYLAAIVREINKCGAGLDFDENYYDPQLLRLAIKQLKTFINTFDDFASCYFLEGFEELTAELNGYDVNSSHFYESEKVFKSNNDKGKTLKWFEKSTNITKTKAAMQGDNKKLHSGINSNSSSTELITNIANSPIYSNPNDSKSEIHNNSNSKDSVTLFYSNGNQ